MSHLVKNKNKKANATIETGYATVYDLENNRIDETLIRYIPGENNNNIIDNSNNYETYSYDNHGRYDCVALWCARVNP